MMILSIIKMTIMYYYFQFFISSQKGLIKIEAKNIKSNFFIFLGLRQKKRLKPFFSGKLISLQSEIKFASIFY